MTAMPQTDRARERKWEIESAADTLTKAEELKADKKLMVEVRKELAKRQKALDRVQRSNVAGKRLMGG